MRIIAGEKKGLRLKTLLGDNTRPTKDMVKEALFSSLGNISGARFLDLFAGSGAVGLEALSRGAKELVLCDDHPLAIKIIKENLALANYRAKVINADYQKALEGLDEKFDYIFLDPPYRFLDHDKLMSLLERLTNDTTIIIWEIEAKNELSDRYQTFKKYKERRYGITKLVYFKKEEA